jgi:8-oxo-dGTP diphosphatase
MPSPNTTRSDSATIVSRCEPFNRPSVQVVRAKLEYSPLATAFCADEFTISELRGIYEAVWGTPLDPRNFHRKATKTDGSVEPLGATTTRDGGRPAQLFRSGSARALYPPLTRS